MCVLVLISVAANCFSKDFQYSAQSVVCIAFCLANFLSDFQR